MELTYFTVKMILRFYTNFFQLNCFETSQAIIYELVIVDQPTTLRELLLLCGEVRKSSLSIALTIPVYVEKMPQISLSSPKPEPPGRSNQRMNMVLITVRRQVRYMSVIRW